MSAPNDFKSQYTTGKLGARDTAELNSVTPEELDGVLWLDVVRVSKERGRFVLRDTKSNQAEPT